MTRGRRALDDLDWEMRDHIERETQENIARGMTPGEAYDAARRAFGSTLRAAEDARAVWVARWLDQLRQDTIGGLRNVRRYPVAALVAVLSLGAGIGGASITLTVRDAVFRRSSPTYRDPARLSRVQVDSPDSPDTPGTGTVPAGLVAAWASSVGDRIGASAPTVVQDVRTADRTAVMATRAVTPSLFDVLGVPSALGRGFSPRPIPSGPAEAVLSDRAWQELFDRRPDVVGRPLWIDNQPFIVTGVMPARFWFVETDSPIWTALDLERAPDTTRLDVVVRRPGASTPAALNALLQPDLAAYAARLPAGQRRLALSVSGIEGTPLGRQVAAAVPYMLSTAVLLTLFIACANVAVLLIAQWTAREREIAIRAAIGASRWRLVRSLLTESIGMAGAAALLGLAVLLGLRAFVLRSNGDGAFYDLSLSPLTLAWTAGLALAAGLAAGLAPALHGTRTVQGDPFRVIAGSGRAPQRWRHSLVVLEIAVTVALLVQTSALVDGYRRWMRPSMGFDTRPLLSANVENPNGIPVGPLLDLIGRLPGVQSAAASTSVPLRMRAASTRVAGARGAEAITVERAAVTPSFFGTLGARLLAGRGLQEGGAEPGREAVLGDTLASRLFPNGRALGATAWIDGVPHEVVGIVADYADRPLQPAGTRTRVYTGLPAAPTRVSFLVRAADPAGLTRSLARGLRDGAPGNVVGGSHTLDQVIRAGGEEILVGTAPLAPLISIGLLLTAAGVYGVLAFSVARRGRELAVRAAVGANGRQLVQLVAAQLFALVGGGLALGIGATFALSRVIRASGGAGSVFDPGPVAFVVPVAVVALLAAAAAWLPARRAGAIDPVRLLRTP